MKKYFIAVFVAIAMCLTVLSGCSLLKSLEKDVTVTLNSDGEILGSYTVNMFNNAIVPKPDVPERFEGMAFIGWTAEENWEEVGAKKVKVSANRELIRYDDVKDYVKKGSITLYAAFVKIDLVIAWYDRESTSGLNEEYMSAFKGNLYTYLRSEGYTPEDMYIDIRGYDGAVGASCAKIMSDGDVDIMVGWSSTSNLTDTGKMVQGKDFIENVSGITIGSKSRYVARVSDKELTNLIFDWIQTEYGAKA